MSGIGKRAREKEREKERKRENGKTAAVSERKNSSD